MADGWDNMVWVGLRVSIITDTPLEKSFLKRCKIVHFNTDYIKYVDETKCLLTTDDGNEWRLDEESMDIFVASIYGTERLKHETSGLVQKK